MILIPRQKFFRDSYLAVSYNTVVRWLDERIIILPFYNAHNVVYTIHNTCLTKVYNSPPRKSNFSGGGMLPVVNLIFIKLLKTKGTS